MANVLRKALTTQYKVVGLSGDLGAAVQEHAEEELKNLKEIATILREFDI